MATKEATGRPDASEGGGTLARVQAAARADFPWYARNFLTVINNQKPVPFELYPAQIKLWEKLKEQRDAGKPMRAIILKARKMGFSTMAQGLLLQRASLKPNHTSVIIAQDTKTAGELFEACEQMYLRLPNDPDLAWCKPGTKRTRHGRELHFGQKARDARARDLGLNSRVFSDTAKEIAAGRGFTNHTVHLSEVAHWDDIDSKLVAVLNTIPQDDMDTLVLAETTANGYNAFRDWWLKAEDGANEYIPFFAGWFEDPRYRRLLPDDIAAERFAEAVGRGQWGGDEHELLARLMREHGDERQALEQLNWRRWAIENLAKGDLDHFRQEYPSNPDEAFIGTGKTVFAANHIRRINEIADVTDPQAESVWLKTTRTSTRLLTSGTINVPTDFEERPWRESDRDDHFWKIWHRPGSEGTSGHFVATLDPAEGEENTAGESDYTVIQVIDWKTRLQCAEFRSLCEPVVAAEQMFLALMLYRHEKNLPLAVVEVTGGYGSWIAKRVWREYGWRNMYFRKAVDPRQKEKQSDLVGFMTDRGSKPMLIDTGKDLIQDGDPGVRSKELAKEFRTYIKVKGKTEAEEGAHDDALMAWLVGQYVAGAKPPRDRKAGGVISTSSYRGQAASVIGRR